jgi:hypothetical protein
VERAKGDPALGVATDEIGDHKTALFDAELFGVEFNGIAVRNWIHLGVFGS